MLIDSHCHLDFPEFSEDRNAFLERARALDIKGFLSINTRLTDAKNLQNIVSPYPDVWCTVGVHPHDAHDYQQASLKEEITTLAHHPKVIGIGETGLDYYYNKSPAMEQIQSFKTHIEAAIDLDLPLIIHARDADEDIIEVLKEYPKAKGVFHCFTGSKELCKKALDLGFYISISGVVTFQKAEDLRQTVTDIIPLDRILVETDAPFLAPVPHRGKPNEPAFVVHTAEFVADLKKSSLQEIASITTKNFFTLFQKAKSNA